MYASVRTYRGPADQMDELLHIADQEFVPKLSEQPGFCAYEMIDCGEGWLVTVSCFNSPEQAEESAELAAEFVRDRLSEFDIERTDMRSGEVRVSVAEQQMLEPAHA